MSYKGVRNWPPVWTHARRGSSRTVRGENGVFRYVHSNTLMSNKLFLVIDYQAESYVGCLFFDDPAFCKQLLHLLHSHIGRPIKEIADLDLSYTL
jgi:hypothetical protein